jgi:hypothetical protein
VPAGKFIDYVGHLSILMKRNFRNRDRKKLFSRIKSNIVTETQQTLPNLSIPAPSPALAFCPEVILPGLCLSGTYSRVLL